MPRTWDPSMKEERWETEGDVPAEIVRASERGDARGVPFEREGGCRFAKVSLEGEGDLWAAFEVGDWRSMLEMCSVTARCGPYDLELTLDGLVAVNSCSISLSQKVCAK